jgi:putative ABC transport system permease protein
MIQNYIKIAFRSLWRNKGFSAINILGLSIGLATCLVIMVFMYHELSFDRFNEKADRIVRVIFVGSVQGEKMKEPHVMPPVAQTLKNDFPEVEEATRLRNAGSPLVTYQGKTFKEDGFAYVDSNFFDVFTLPIIEGNPKTALSQPQSVVITKETAKKYFGNENPLGKVIDIKSWNKSFTITGIIKEVPDASHFHFSFFASTTGLEEARSSSWMSSEFFTYLVLPKGYDYKKLEAKMPGVIDKYLGPQMQEGMGMTLQEFRAKGNDLGLYLQRLTDIHLYSDLNFDLSPGGDISYVYIFGAIAIFMLLIACINFMNLSTAGASRRAKEVGIRKVIGSGKKQLIGQFLAESVVLTFLSLLIAILLVQLFFPVFNQLAGKNIGLSIFKNPLLIIGVFLLVLITGLLAGSYPAFFLSSFKPVAVLKGKFIASKSSFSLRSGLVVFQFFISIVLIICTAVVYRQLNYIQDKKLGYNKEQVLVLPDTWILGDKENLFQQQIMEDSRVVSASISGYVPAGNSNNNNFFLYDTDISTQIKTLRYQIDPQYIPTLGIEMSAGRNFNPSMLTDSNAIIINESAAKAFGWNEDAIGKTLKRNFNKGEMLSYQVIGVVKDFHFKSLHEPISPLVMTMGENSGNIIIKIKTSDIPGLLVQIKNQWSAFGKETPFSYSFLDDRFRKTYEAEQNTGKLMGIFAALTIFVACMGLFGLAMFTAQQRTKEMGIRKVLGASVSNIVTLLSKDFIKLVIVAFIIASPIAWLIMNKWLQDFAYRTDISAWVFVAAAVLSIFIAFITISIQSLKSALANPVNSLRSE